jgi:membrane-associated PAP2 superfamily phosphatase
MPEINAASRPGLRFPGARRRPAILTDPLVIYPLLGLIAALVAVYAFDLDHRWSDLLYRLEGNGWHLRYAWLTSRVLHEYGQRFSIAWGVALLGLTAASFARTRLQPWRRGLDCLCVAVLTSLLLVSLGKHVLALPCPWDLAMYGGDVTGTAVYTFYPGQVGGCFPAGHAAGGYCLVALYFFARHHGLRRARWWLAPGLVIGITYGFAQELRGAHFLSHDIVSLALCWFVSYAVFRIGFRRPTGDRRTPRATVAAEYDPPQ